jgi:hypothetical protein
MSTAFDNRCFYAELYLADLSGQGIRSAYCIGNLEHYSREFESHSKQKYTWVSASLVVLCRRKALR